MRNFLSAVLLGSFLCLTVAAVVAIPNASTAGAAAKIGHR